MIFRLNHVTQYCITFMLIDKLAYGSHELLAETQTDTNEIIDSQSNNSLARIDLVETIF